MERQADGGLPGVEKLTESLRGSDCLILDNKAVNFYKN